MALLIYGATGYTGQLFVREAKSAGIPAVLGGRNEQKLASLSKEYGLEYRVAALDNRQEMSRMLEGITVVLHAAGPFKHTAQPMLEACLEYGVHYLDITGEIGVFETAHALDGAAHAMEIMIMPGVGFDVVPTDCLALFLYHQLPEANRLQLAFTQSGGGISHGTAYTAAEQLGEAGAVRQKGKIIRVPLGHKTMQVPFIGKERFCMTIPWGDVSTAFYTTGIPNIETYRGISPKQYRWVQRLRYVNWLLRTNLVRKLVKRRIDRSVAGPDDESRAAAHTLIWGRVQSESGEQVSARMLTPEGYTLTAKMGMRIAGKVLAENWHPGFQTPAKAYGADLILELEGVRRELYRDGSWVPA